MEQHSLEALQQENQQLREQIAAMTARLEHHERSATPAASADSAPRSSQEAFQADELELFRAILEASSDNILVWDEQYNYLYANQSAIDQVGTTRDKVIGKNIRDGLGHIPDFMKLWMSRIDHVIATGETLHREESLQIGDNTATSVSTMFPIHDKAGKVYAMGLIYRDITEQKRAEEDWLRLVAIAENSPDFIGMASFEGVPLYVNPAGMALVGLENMDHARQHNITDFFPAEELPFAEQEILPTVMSNGFWQGEFRFRHFQTGEPIPVHYTLFLATNPATGVPLGIGTVTRDITEQKRVEAERQQLVAFVENTDDLVTQVNPDGNFTYVNTAVERFLGRPASECIGLSAFDIIHPDDQEQTQKAFMGWIEQRTTSASFENRLINHDGNVIPALWTISLRYDEHGNLEHINSICRDMTAYKQQQDAVSIFKTMADTAPDGFGMADADGTLTYANAAYRALTGYGDALIGMNFLDHFTEADRVVALEALTTTAEQGDWQGVLNFQRQDGSVIPIDTKGFVARDEAGTIVAVMGLFRDLSEQYRQEEERAALQQQVIDAQRQALRELSTPLIPISDNVLIMPLIGTIDSQRAQQVMEALLEGVAQHQADLVVLDITGVAVVDTQVAQSFIQAAQAVRLLGAQVMLTGIQPQIAQTLVHLGVDLSGIQTQGSLQAGIASALRQ
jgi:rsbT co-antagonist protein RsbR